MTDSPSLQPPSKLVQEWTKNCTVNDVVSKAAQWGADAELKACCEWVSRHCPYFGDWPMPEDALLAARRPQQRTTKEQALAILDDPTIEAAHYNILRHALDQLPND